MRKTFLAILLILAIPLTQAPSLSVTPGNIGLGELEQGETTEVNFYLKPTGVNQPIEVRPSYKGPFQDTLFGTNSLVEPDEVSEQNIADWVDFSQDTYTVDPSVRKEFTLPDGSDVVASKEITMEIDVPPQAEPGYRAGKASFSVVGSQGDGNLAAATWVIPNPTFTFRVPGNAQRELSFDDARAFRIAENEVQIIATIQNTGTVTTSLDGGGVEILNPDNQKVGQVYFDSTTVEPSEVQEVSMIWRSDSLDEGGSYRLSGTGNYMTGRFFIGDNIAFTDAISDRVQVEESSPEGSEGQEGGLPTWMVLMMLVLLGVIMYSFDIDPLWIVLIVGLLAITAFVFIADLPAYVIGITLILGVGTVYYVI